MKFVLLAGFLLAATTGGCPVIVPPKPDQAVVQQSSDVPSRFISQYSKSVDTKILGQIYASKLEAVCSEISEGAKSGKYYDLSELEEDWGKKAKQALSESWDEFRQSESVRSAHRGASAELTAELNKLSGKDPSEDEAVAKSFSRLAAGFQKASK